MSGSKLMVILDVSGASTVVFENMPTCQHYSYVEKKNGKKDFLLSWICDLCSQYAGNGRDLSSFLDGKATCTITQVVYGDLLYICCMKDNLCLSITMYHFKIHTVNQIEQPRMAFHE